MTLADAELLTRALRALAKCRTALAAGPYSTARSRLLEHADALDRNMREAAAAALGVSGEPAGGDEDRS